MRLKRNSLAWKIWRKNEKPKSNFNLCSIDVSFQRLLLHVQHDSKWNPIMNIFLKNK